MGKCKVVQHTLRLPLILSLLQFIINNIIMLLLKYYYYYYQ